MRLWCDRLNARPIGTDHRRTGTRVHERFPLHLGDLLLHLQVILFVHLRSMHGLDLLQQLAGHRWKCVYAVLDERGLRGVRNRGGYAGDQCSRREWLQCE